MTHHDSDDDNDDVEVRTYPPVRFDPWHLVVVAASFLDDIATAAAEATSSIYDATAMHGNWRLERARFADQTRRDIETITHP